jgi:hypothetical protein
VRSPSSGGTILLVQIPVANAVVLEPLSHSAME